MLKKALVLGISLILAVNLTACGGISVRDSHGNKKKIDSNNSLEWDIGKQESVWSMAFNIQHEYEGLPPAFNEDSLQHSALNNSAFGKGFKEDFINNNEPYYLYKIYISLKDGWYLSDDFKIKISDTVYSVNDILSKEYIEMKVRSVDMPKEKTISAWQKLLDKNNRERYKQLIETYFINSHYGIEYVSGIVYSDK